MLDQGEQPDVKAVMDSSLLVTIVLRHDNGIDDMSIECFEDLLQAAVSQPQPQRLLFVFTSAGLPDDATEEQRARYEAGEGGTLTPLVSVDKLPSDLRGFDALVAESRQFAPAWDIVFVAAISGSGGSAPTSEEAELALKGMVEAVNIGRIDGLIPFDASGQTVSFS